MQEITVDRVLGLVNECLARRATSRPFPVRERPVQVTVMPSIVRKPATL